MQGDPFERYQPSSPYHTGEQGEQASLRRVQQRIDDIVQAATRPRAGHLWRIIALTGIAATVLAVVLIGPFDNSGDGQLAEVYFTAYPNYVTPAERGDRSESHTERAAAFEAYDAGQFNQAVGMFRELDTATATDMFYLAQALQATGEWEAALEVLLTLGDIDPEYRPAVRWHTALSRLATGEKELARAILIPLVTTNTAFSSRARELLDAF
ncbi:MAG: tetratricopeptide repeat protein [Saprospiraceae bacterium]|nr:tetratricopeptide repeat protein [Saprospiraceae bacterium]